MKPFKKNIPLPPVALGAKPSREAVALICAKFASDRTRPNQVSLPMPGSPECDATFLAAWAAHKHVTAELGRKHMREKGMTFSMRDTQEAFVHGRTAFPSHVRWAEAEAMVRAGEEWPK